MSRSRQRPISEPPPHRRRGWGFPLLALAAVAALCPPPADAELRVLVFTKTASFRHLSIPAGIALVQDLGATHGWTVEATEDAAVFTTAELAGFDVAVWLNTTGDVLDTVQEDVFRSWIEGGGGFVGVHAAADTEHDWPWYGELLGGGAYFLSHPTIQTAQLDVETRHLSTRDYPIGFTMTDEWYNFAQNPRSSVTVLITIDESSYNPGAHPMGDHPIAWAHPVGAGRSWYTNMGHRIETYGDPGFARHLLGGILWAGGAVFFDDFENGGTSHWSRTQP